MTEENMNQTQQSGSEIAEELRILGLHLREMLRTAWESPERKKVQQEIQNGLTDLGATINSTANEFSASPTGQTLKADVEDIKQRLRSGEAEAKIREEILKTLKMVNAEMEKVAPQSTQSPGDEPPPEA